MRNYLGRTVILVEDYKKAFRFYSKNFGFKAIFDLTTDDGQRYLHIGTDPHDSCGIWFLKAENEEQKALVGNQTGGQPTLVIYTTDLDEQYKSLLENDVIIKREPVQVAQYKFLHCLDLYGNEIILTELEE